MLKEIIKYISEYDGSEHQAIIAAPDNAKEEPFPLVIIPHAAGYSATDTASYWRDLPERRGIIAVFPFGHGRKLETFSLGWRGQISDLAQMPDIAENSGYHINRSMIFAVGISMGGQESLLLAGSHPEIISGVVVFNAVTDLAMLFKTSSTLAPVIADETGGTPDEIPDEYKIRSPINYSATISKVPTLLYWDPEDEMVPGQDDRQSGALYSKMKKSIYTGYETPVWSKKHNYGHFWINPGKAISWLLENYRK